MSKTATVDVNINNEKARARLNEIGEELKRLKLQKDKFMQEGNASGVDLINKEMKKLTAESGKLQKSVTEVDRVLKNLSGASMRELLDVQRKLTREITNSTRNTKEEIQAIEEKKRKLALVNQELAKQKINANAGTAMFAKLQAIVSKVIVFAAAIGAAYYALKKFYDAADEQRIADRRLLFALDNNIDAFNRLKKQADELQQIDGLDDAVISQIQMLGVTSGKSVKDVEKITKATVELSAVTGDDLQTSYMQLNNTFNGKIGKSLPRLSSDFSALTKEQLANGAAIDMVLEKYEGTAEKSASATNKMKMAWGEFIEAIGVGTMGPMDNLLNKLASFLGKMKDLSEVFLQFGGNRDAWLLSKEAIDSNSKAVERYEKSIANAAKNKKTWESVKKSTLTKLDSQIQNQQNVINQNEKKMAVAAERYARAKGSNVIVGAFASKDEINRLQTLLTLEKSHLDMLKTKKSIVQNYGKKTESGEDDDDTKQKTSYEKLNESIGKYKDKITELELAKQPIPEQMKLEYQALLLQKKAVDDLVASLSSGANAYELLSSSIGELEKKLKTQIASGDAGSVETLEKLTAAKAELARVDDVFKFSTTHNDEVAKQMDSYLAEYDKLLEKQIDIDADAIEDELTRVAEAEDKKLKLHQETEEKKQKASEEKRKEWKDATLSMAQEVSNAAFTIWSNNQAAEYDSKINKLDKQRDKELENKRLTEAQKDAINEKYNKKIAKLKLEQWEKQRNADILQAVINTALAVTKLLANPAAAIAAGVAGAAQVAVIASQKAPEFYYGGYTQQGLSDHSPAGVVHQNEFVGTAAAVRNPTVKPLFDVVDYAQRNGTISNLNLGALVSTSSRRNVEFGNASATSGTVAPFAPFSAQSIQVLDEFNKTMNRAISEGLHTRLSLYDFQKFEDKKDTVEQFSNM